MAAASTTVAFTAAGFPTTPPLNLLDYEVNVLTVHGNDAWAGQHIGIKIESVFGYGDGYWDIDNVRLEATTGRKRAVGQVESEVGAAVVPPPVGERDLRE